MAPKIIIHIGSAKTGTSSIQEYLRINYSALYNSSFAVPKFLGFRQHVWFPQLFIAHHRLDHYFWKKQCVSTQEGANLLVKEKKNQLINFLQACSSSQTILISSEWLDWLKDEEVVDLKNFLDSLGCFDVRIIAYIRDPLQAAISAKSSAIKQGRDCNLTFQSLRKEVS